MKGLMRGWRAPACALLLAGCASLPRRVAEGVVDRWSGPSASAGRELLARYGLPDDATPNRLTWNRRGAWRRTTVWNRPTVYRSLADMAVIEQTVDYPLDSAKAADLLAFSDDLVVDLARGELSSRAARQELNCLTLNLADEIVRGVKTVPEARDARARIAALAAAGKTSDYTRGLRFGTRQE